MLILGLALPLAPRKEEIIPGIAATPESEVVETTELEFVGGQYVDELDGGADAVTTCTDGAGWLDGGGQAGLEPDRGQGAGGAG